MYWALILYAKEWAPSPPYQPPTYGQNGIQIPPTAQLIPTAVPALSVIYFETKLLADNARSTILGMGFNGQMCVIQVQNEK